MKYIFNSSYVQCINNKLCIIIAVIDDIPTPYDDEPYCSDEELEMAYFASRYTANSKSPTTSTH